LTRRYTLALHKWADTQTQLGWGTFTPATSRLGTPPCSTKKPIEPGCWHTRSTAHGTSGCTPRRGGDDQALAEITSAANLLRTPTEYRDLSTLVHLAFERGRLLSRNRNIPTDLPAVWARLGHARRAVALARSISPNQNEALALSNVALALAEAGDTSEAERVAGLISDDYQRRGRSARSRPAWPPPATPTTPNASPA